MTPSDLQTCRDWCRANGVEIVHKPLDKYPWKAIHDLNFLSDFSEDSEWEVYQDIWQQLKPWLASVRNLDAVEVPGPYKVAKYSGADKWHVFDNDEDFGFLSEQTARTIANLLNRECGDGK